MQEGPKRADAHAPRNFRVAWTINAARPDYDVRDCEFFRKFRNDLLLLDLSEAARVSRELRMRFDGTGLVQAPRFLAVGVNRERADKDKSLQARILQACLEQVAGGDDRVHKGIGERFLTGAGGQVIDDRYTFACRFAIGAGEEIASKHLDARP